MSKQYLPITPRYPHILHGGDYNPDQWSRDIWNQDIRLMKRCGVNAMTLPVFGWTALEPSEGVLDFEWLDEILDKLDAAGIKAVLATPTAAQPAWMSKAYPEVLRTASNRVRNEHRVRVNYCLTSPIFREKCAIIAEKLATRYKDHPALILWHVNNEYHGDCHCELCQAAFQEWLKSKYQTLNTLNDAWWTGHWSHQYTAWDEIRSPQPWPEGEWSILGLGMDWKRFVTDQTVSLCKNEVDVLRRITPDVPVTANMHQTLSGTVNWYRLAPLLDAVSWDSYPCYENEPDNMDKPVEYSLLHDIHRGYKNGRPFLMMESRPGGSVGRRQPRPGQLKLSGLQAIAHGADSVQYFQWRDGRGGTEKYHGAIVNHIGHENTRLFGEVTALSETLSKLDGVVGCGTDARVAMICDIENKWALEYSTTARFDEREYLQTCVRHYKPFWSRGISVDVIPMEADFGGYSLLIAPLLYMLLPGVAERIEAFVENGGTFVTTYWSGYVDQHDRCFAEGFPGPEPFRRVLGFWSEELDGLLKGEENRVVFENIDGLQIKDECPARYFCEIVHPTTAQIAARLKHDYYKGSPAITVNTLGKGQAWYLATDIGPEGLDKFYANLQNRLHISSPVSTPLPAGVTVQRRENEHNEYFFLMNFSQRTHKIELQKKDFTDIVTGCSTGASISIPPYGSLVLVRSV